MQNNTAPSDRHTPGPWEWTTNYTSSTNEPTWSLIDGTGYGILSCDGIGNSPQGLGGTGHANARLIAVAPELLGTAKSTSVDCSNVAECLRKIGGTECEELASVLDSVVARNEAAIAKAEGRAE